MAQYLEIYDLMMKRLCILNPDIPEKAKNISEEFVLNGINTLSFDLPLSSPFWKNIINEYLVKWNGEYYKIKNPNFKHSREEKTVTVECKHLSCSLQQKMCPIYNEIGKDAGYLLDTVLTDTGWLKGVVSIDINKKRALQVQEQSSFSNLVKIAELFDAMLLFNSDTRTVDLIDTIIYRGIQIRKGKNLKGIQINYDSNEAVVTRLYAFGGSDAITGNPISLLGAKECDINENIILDGSGNPIIHATSFIEDYSYYQTLYPNATIDYFKNNPHLFLHEKTWNATDYVSRDDLYRDGLKQLKKICKPVINCTLNAMDVSNIPEYRTERPLLGETIKILDEDLDLEIDVKVTNIKVNYDNPSDLQITISDIIEYNSIMKNLVDGANITNKNTTAQGQVNGFQIKDGTIENAKIINLDAGKITVGDMLADRIKGGQLILGGGTTYGDGEEIIKDALGNDIIKLNKDGITILNGKIIINNNEGTLILDGQGINATAITTGYLVADRIKGGSLILGGLNNGNGEQFIKDADGNNAIILNKDGIQVINGKITILDNNGELILNGTGINASSIVTGTIDANTIDVVNLNATNITTGVLKGNLIESNSIVASQLKTSTITAGSGIIADGAIGNAQISNLNASKLNAGTIDTASVTVQGTNGRLKISGNRLQVFDENAEHILFERVALGDINADGTIYGFRVRGTDGTTLLIDENGVHEEGITDGAITNAKISDTANISGTKLDITSVITSINNGTTTINGSKILLTDKTLDVAFSEVQQTQTTQGQTISSHTSSISLLNDAVSTKVESQIFSQAIDGLQGQIDGNITSWFFDGVPTLSNNPTIDWIDDATKNIHLGDLYYDNLTGYCYRFKLNGSIYEWTIVKDTDVTKALADASKAQATADGKKRVFIVQPIPPYDLGDLWSQGTTGDLMKCKVARTTGSYLASDWEKASKYTDDTVANQAIATLNDIANDSKLTPNEKAITKKEWDVIVSEKVINDTQADLFGITTEKTTYDTAYTTLNTYITSLLANLTTTSDIVGDTFRLNFKNYYDARTNLLNAVATKSKDLADSALSGVDNLDFRVSSAEQKITDESIASAVKRTQIYQSQVLVPNYSDLTVARAGLSLNPLQTYNFVSGTVFDNNVLVNVDIGISGLVYIADLEIVNNQMVTFSLPSARIESAETLIQQNAEDILQRVSKDGVISEINQSAEEVKIIAGKIGLLGETNIPDLTANKIKGGTLELGGQNLEAKFTMKDTSGNVVLDSGKDANNRYNIRALDGNGNTRAVFGNFATNKYGTAIYNQYGELVTGSDRPPAKNVNGIGVAGAYINISNETNYIVAQTTISSYIQIPSQFYVASATGFTVGDTVFFTARYVSSGKYIIENSTITAVSGNYITINDSLGTSYDSFGKLYKLSQPTVNINISDGFAINKNNEYIKIPYQTITRQINCVMTSDFDGFIWTIIYLDSNNNIQVATLGTTGSFLDNVQIAGEQKLDLANVPDINSLNTPLNTTITITTSTGGYLKKDSDDSTYRYKITAIMEDGTESYPSDWEESGMAQTGYLTKQVSWTSVQGAVAYNIYRCYIKDFTAWLTNQGIYNLLTTTTSTNFTDDGTITERTDIHPPHIVVLAGILSGLTQNNNLNHPNIQTIHQVFHDHSIRSQLPYYVDELNQLTGSFTNYTQYNNSVTINAYSYKTILLPIGANKKSVALGISTGTKVQSSYGFFGITGRRNPFSQQQYLIGMSPSNRMYMGEYSDYSFGQAIKSIGDVYTIDGSTLCLVDAYVTELSNTQALKVLLWNGTGGAVTKNICINAHAF